jgi:hypothetical protein
MPMVILCKWTLEKCTNRPCGALHATRRLDALIQIGVHIVIQERKRSGGFVAHRVSGAFPAHQVSRGQEPLVPHSTAPFN